MEQEEFYRQHSTRRTAHTPRNLNAAASGAFLASQLSSGNLHSQAMQPGFSQRQPTNNAGYLSQEESRIRNISLRNEYRPSVPNFYHLPGSMGFNAQGTSTSHAQYTPNIPNWVGHAGTQGNQYRSGHSIHQPSLRPPRNPHVGTINMLHSQPQPYNRLSIAPQPQRRGMNNLRTAFPPQNYLHGNPMMQSNRPFANTDARSSTSVNVNRPYAAQVSGMQSNSSVHTHEMRGPPTTPNNMQSLAALTPSYAALHSSRALSLQPEPVMHPSQSQMSSEQAAAYYGLYTEMDSRRLPVSHDQTVSCSDPTLYYVNAPPPPRCKKSGVDAEVVTLSSDSGSDNEKDKEDQQTSKDGLFNRSSNANADTQMENVTSSDESGDPEPIRCVLEILKVVERVDSSDSDLENEPEPKRSKISHNLSNEDFNFQTLILKQINLTDEDVSVEVSKQNLILPNPGNSPEIEKCRQISVPSNSQQDLSNLDKALVEMNDSVPPQLDPKKNPTMLNLETLQVNKDKAISAQLDLKKNPILLHPDPGLVKMENDKCISFESHPSNLDCVVVKTELEDYEHTNSQLSIGTDPAEVETSSIIPVESEPFNAAPVDVEKCNLVQMDSQQLKSDPIEVAKKHLVPMEAQQSNFDPVEFTKKNLVPMESQQLNTEPVEVMASNLVPMESQVLNPDPVEVQMKNIVPMESQVLNPGPVEVEMKNIVPMESQVLNPGPVEVEMKNVVPMESQVLNPGPVEVEMKNIVPTESQQLNPASIPQIKSEEDLFRPFDVTKLGLEPVGLESGLLPKTKTLSRNPVAVEKENSTIFVMKSHQPSNLHIVEVKKEVFPQMTPLDQAEVKKSCFDSRESQLNPDLVISGKDQNFTCYSPQPPAPVLENPDPMLSESCEDASLSKSSSPAKLSYQDSLFATDDEEGDDHGFGLMDVDVDLDFWQHETIKFLRKRSRTVPEASSAIFELNKFILTGLLRAHVNVKALPSFARSNIVIFGADKLTMILSQALCNHHDLLNNVSVKSINEVAHFQQISDLKYAVYMMDCDKECDFATLLRDINLMRALTTPITKVDFLLCRSATTGNLGCPTMAEFAKLSKEMGIIFSTFFYDIPDCVKKQSKHIANRFVNLLYL